MFDPQAAAQAQLVAAQQAVYAAWAGVAVNGLVVAVTAWLAIRATRESAQLRRDAAIADYKVAVTLASNVVTILENIDQWSGGDEHEPLALTESETLIENAGTVMATLMARPIPGPLLLNLVLILQTTVAGYRHFFREVRAKHGSSVTLGAVLGDVRDQLGHSVRVRKLLTECEEADLAKLKLSADR